MNIAFLGMFRIISNPAAGQQPELGKITAKSGKGEMAACAFSAEYAEAMGFSRKERKVLLALGLYWHTFIR